MNLAHAHIAINHLPVIGSIFVFLLLVVAAARKSEELRRVALGACVLVALSAIPVYLTGEPAEEIIEHQPGVVESVIERHEESAIFPLVFAEVLGAGALAGILLYRRGKNMPRWFMLALIILSTAVVGSMGWTANLGGQIRHPEARPGFNVSAAESPQ